MKKELLLCVTLLLGAYTINAQCGNQNPDFEGGINPDNNIPNWYFSFGNAINLSTDTPDGSGNSASAPDGGAVAIDNYISEFTITPGDEYQFCADMSVTAADGSYVFSQIKMEFKSADNSTVLGESSTGTPDGAGWANYCTSAIAPPGTGRISVFAQTNGGASFLVDNFCVTNLTALPIELADIAAYAKDRVNIIEWSTKSEENVELFEIQKSTNGADRWRAITTIDAAGFSNTDQYYEVEDKSPASLSYYRIISRDFDGKSETTPVVVVKREKSAEPISLFPNPASSSINVNVSLQEPTDYAILDIHGRTLAAGVFSANQDSYELEVDHLIPGVYLLKTNTSILRFFKQ